jgi:hypothetical protein
MKTLLRLVVIATVAFGAAPAISAEAWQAFECELIDEKSETDVLAGAKKWLAAARTMKGGENMELSVHFPVATGSGELDFVFIIKAPSFAEWGIFWDNYEGSAAHEIDKQADEITVCPISRLFEGVTIEVD